jgi:hypothetical protein
VADVFDKLDDARVPIAEHLLRETGAAARRVHTPSQHSAAP